jgi:hypothetical protein
MSRMKADGSLSMLYASGYMVPDADQPLLDVSMLMVPYSTGTRGLINVIENKGVVEERSLCQRIMWRT